MGALEGECTIFLTSYEALSEAFHLKAKTFCNEFSMSDA